MSDTIKKLKWTRFEILWLGLFSILALFISFREDGTLPGLTSFLSGVLCVVLTAKGNIFAFWWGYINILSYAWIAVQNGLYGEAGLNLIFFLPVNFIGHCLWHQNIRRRGVLEIRRLKWSVILCGLLCILLLSLLLGWALSLISGQKTPYLDALTNTLSIAAALLLTFRCREQWLCWILLNICTITMWAIRWVYGGQQSATMVIMWSAYLINAFYGWYNWNKHSGKK